MWGGDQGAGHSRGILGMQTDRPQDGGGGGLGSNLQPHTGSHQSPASLTIFNILVNALVRALPRGSQSGLFTENLEPHDPSTPFTQTTMQIIVTQRKDTGMGGTRYYQKNLHTPESPFRLEMSSLGIHMHNFVFVHLSSPV